MSEPVRPSLSSQRAAVFDFDGTIADSLAEVVEVYNRIARDMGIPTVSAADGPRLRKMKPLEALRAYDIPVWKVPAITQAVRAGLRARIDAVQPFEGVHAAVQQLRAAGIRCFILSSNSSDNIRQFLARHGMQEFELLSGGSSLFGKGPQLRKLIRHANLPDSEVFYVGDEVRDIVAAAEAGVRSVAVTWGYSDREALVAQRPDFLVDTPDELVRVLMQSWPGGSQGPRSAPHAG